MLLLASSAVVLGIVAIAVVYWRSGAQQQEHVTLEMALGALDRHEFVRAQELAEQLRAQSVLQRLELGGPAFVMGASHVYEADERWGKDKGRAYLIAARYLEEARDRGFPTGRKEQGLRLLGRCQYLSGQYTAAAFTLNEALAANPQNPSEFHRLLVESYARDANPQFDKALAHSEMYLSDRLLSAEARHVGMLRRCELLHRLGRRGECSELLSQIPDDARNRGEVNVMQGQLLLDEARKLRGDAPSGEALSKHQAAIARFREAQSHDSLGASATREALYLIGVSYSEMGDRAAAQVQFERTRKLHADSPEGLAASLRYADLLRDQGQHEAAVSAYRETFVAAGSPRDYSNPWVSLEEFRAAMRTSQQWCLNEGRFESALALLDVFSPMYSRVRTIELRAATYRAWAEALSAEADSLPETQAVATRQEAARRWRKAGFTYSKLAKLRVATRAYPDDVWNAAESLHNGRDYVTAVELLKEYLKNESRGKRPLALVALGQAQLALGDVEAAVKAFEECIELHPRDAATYEARVWCSKAYLELGEGMKAERLLNDNLHGGTLTPASREWRDSLFALGKLLHSEGRHEEAIIKLEEAVARYPDTAQAFEGVYLIAEAHRQAASAPQRKLAEATIESVRIAHRRQIKRLLEGALRYYSQVQSSLLRREEAADLSELESAMLRNCYFSSGSVLFDLGRFEDAIKSYSDASTRYQNEPLVLEALVQIADCHRRLGRMVEARGALEQAKVVWKRLPIEVAFTDSTNYSRDEWISLLDQLSSW